MGHEKLSIGHRVIYFLAMLLYLSLAFLMAVLILKLRILPGDIVYGIFFGVCALGLGFASFMFGYKVFMPSTRHGWIKNKLAITAVLSFLFVIFLAISAPGYLGYQTRAYDSDAKSNLHNIFMACKAYWADNGSDAVCTSTLAQSTVYGYIQSADVDISASGAETVFSATAQNINSTKTFRIDSEGTITEVDGK